MRGFADFILGGLMLSLSLLCLFVAHRLWNGWDGPGTMPLIVGTILLFLALGFWVVPSKDRMDFPLFKKRMALPMFVTLGSFALFILFVKSIGYPLCSWLLLLTLVESMKRGALFKTAIWTGKEFVNSLIISGFEAGIRIGEAVNPSHWEFWHPTGTCGTFAAFAGCARLLRLTPQEMAFGFGVAGTQAAGLRFYEGMNKHLHPGKAAMNGLLAALLAKKGFTGDERIFESDTGFCKAMAKDFRLDKITERLPLTEGNFRSTENSFKPHASCRHTHPAIDAVLKIVEGHPLEPRDVKSVSCRTYSAATRLLKDPTVRDSVSAKFSLPFCIATAIKDKGVGLDSFTIARMNDLEIRNLMGKVSVHVDPLLEKAYPAKWPAEIEILTSDGQKLVERVDFPKGDPENPMNEKEIVKKYLELTFQVDENMKASIMERVLNLEKIKDMGMLFS